MQDVLQQSLKEVADIKFALDQHAIVAITDVRGCITYVNDKFCEISQYPRAELLGQDHRIINSSYHPKEFIRHLWTTIANGSVWHGEIRNRAKDGSFYWVDTTIVPFLDETGKPTQYVAIRNDITERKRLENEMARSAKLSLMGELAASLAHEIKNPLAGIQGAVDILINRREPSDPERNVLTDVRHEVERIDTVVRQMLAQTRLRALSLSSASLVEIVRRAVQLSQQTASLARSNVSITLTLEIAAEDALILLVDAAQLEDAVLNLLLNALDAIGTKDQGLVQARVFCESGEFGEEAVITVSDNGPGLSVEDQQRIFKPFFTTKTDGTGLGLSAVRRIVRTHGGRVEVSSQLGAGATFAIRLPLK